MLSKLAQNEVNRLGGSPQTVECKWVMSIPFFSREMLKDSQASLAELQDRYKIEKEESDSNKVLLNKAQMSIEHLKV